MTDGTLEDGIGAIPRVFGTLREVSSEQALPDELTIHILVAPDEYQK
jgi:hypothetical protein